MAEKKMMKELNEELELAGALARYIEMELKKKLPPPRKKETRPGYLTYNSDELLLQGMLLAMLTRLQGMSLKKYGTPSTKNNLNTNGRLILGYG